MLFKIRIRYSNDISTIGLYISWYRVIWSKEKHQYKEHGILTF